MGQTTDDMENVSKACNLTPEEHIEFRKLVVAWLFFVTGERFSKSPLISFVDSQQFQNEAGETRAQYYKLKEKASYRILYAMTQYFELHISKYSK